MRTNTVAAGALAALLAAAPTAARAQAPAQSPDGGRSPSFILVNDTGRVIVEAYASPTSQSEWGEDRLGSEVLQPGGAFAVRLPRGACAYDLRVVLQGAGAEERRGVDLCAVKEVAFGAPAAPPATTGGKGAPAASAARTGNPSFNLVNRSGRTIREFYASPASRTEWGPDVLGASVVAAGATFAVRLPEGECAHDLRAVYDDDRAEERRGVDLCAVSSVAFP